MNAVPQRKVGIRDVAAATGADPGVAYLDIDPVTIEAACARTLIALLEGDSVQNIVRSVELVPARIG